MSLLSKKSALGQLLILTVIAAAQTDAVMGPPMPPPFNLSVTSECPMTLLQWTGDGPATAYEVQVLSDGMVEQDQTAMTTMLLVTLRAGNYAFQVRAVPTGGPFASSPFSEPLGFTVDCQSCEAPTIQNFSLSPTTLWPPNGQMVTVTLTGKVASSCPVTACQYLLTDSQGSGQFGDVMMQSDGSFSVGMPLSASRSGSDLQGRLYGLSVQATNPAGTGSSGSLTVIVPHDQGQ